MTVMATAQTAMPAANADSRPAPLIVHVTRQFAPSRGGLEDVIGNLCRQLLTRGYRVRVVTCNTVFAVPGVILPAFEVIDGIEVVRIPWSGTTRYPFAPKVFQHLKDADLVHVHAIDFFFDALAWGRPLHGRPMVATTHGGFFHTPKFAAIKKIWFRTLTRLSASAYRRLICCSSSDFQLFSQIAGRRVVTIENGANTEKFAGRAALAPTRRIVSIGRFSVNKRLDRLLDAMQALVSRDDRWHLDIIGAPSDLSVEDLATLIAARGLSAHVAIHAAVSEPQMAAVIAEASFFASASDYEGFGLVAVEAMSAGLLPVLHRNDAYKALAGRHSDLVLADFADPNGVAAALIDAHAWISTAGAALRNHLIDDAQAYSWTRVAERYVAVYEEVMAGR